MDIKLSEHFTYDEMTRSNTAKRLGIINTPGPKELKNLQILCLQVLEPARNEIGHPLIVTSGYRCKALNKAVGGVAGSYHVMGMAADLRIRDEEEGRRLVDALQKQTLCDMVLLELTRNSMWVHVQYSTRPRHIARYHYNA